MRWNTRQAEEWRAPRRAPAFTLIELLVVIAIIGLLSSIVFASLNSARVKARDARRIADLREVQKALELYYADHGSYPTTGGAWWGTEPQGGVACYGNRGAGAIPGLVPAYISSIPRDPNPSVGHCYLYRSDGKDYKFIAHQTMEACTAGQCPLQDPKRSGQRTSAVFSSDRSRHW